jgi:hypothetical protein
VVYSERPNQLPNYSEKILGDKQSPVFFMAGSSIFKTNRVQLIQPTISLEMPVPSQGHYGFHSFPVVD